MSCHPRALILLAVMLTPLGGHAQDQTSGDDARPMTQRICDQSPGSCSDMQARHEFCQKHPAQCQGSKTDNAEAHDRAAATGNSRYPAAPVPAGAHPPKGHQPLRHHSSGRAAQLSAHHEHHRAQAAGKAGARTPAEALAPARACRANPRRCARQ